MDSGVGLSSHPFTPTPPTPCLPPPLSERGASRAQNFNIFPSHFFLHFVFPLPSPAPLLPPPTHTSPPVPSSPLPLTLSIPSLTSLLLYEIKYSKQEYNMLMTGADLEGGQGGSGPPPGIFMICIAAHIIFCITRDIHLFHITTVPQFCSFSSKFQSHALFIYFYICAPSPNPLT